MPNERPLTSDEIDDGWCLDEEPAEPPEPYYAEYLVELSPDETPAPTKRHGRRKRFKKRRAKRSNRSRAE